MRLAVSLLSVISICLPALGQTLSDRFAESSKGWGVMLGRGDGSGVRKAAEAMILRDGAAVSGTDYNEMRVLVALYEISARASVLEGAWEDAVAFLQKAVATSSSSYDQSDALFAKIRKEHEQKLGEWRERVATSEKRIQELDQATGLPEQAVKEKKQLQFSLEEHKRAIAHSEKSLREIQGLLDQIREVRDVYAKSLSEWQSFLAKEKVELAQAATPSKYVADKLEQVKADESKPKTERLAYVRRLHRLDPSNQDCPRLTDALLGNSEAASASRDTARTATAPKRKKK